MQLKEGFLVYSMSGLEVNEIEDIRFKLIESILLCKLSIRENRGISAKKELERLEELYGSVQ